MISENQCVTISLDAGGDMVVAYSSIQSIVDDGHKTKPRFQIWMAGRELVGEASRAEVDRLTSKWKFWLEGVVIEEAGACAGRVEE